MAAPRPATFTGFGDSVLVPAVRRPLVQIPLSEDRERCRELVRETAPASPGVYGWVDRNQQLLYVGKSKSLRHRLLSYFDKAPAEPKSERMRQASSRIVWEAVSHELLALIREQELIFRWRPSFNRMGQPERRQPGFVCVTGGSAPRVVVTTDPNSNVRVRVGPVTGLSDLREAVEQVNYVFGLRDCSDRTRMHLSPQLPLFGESLHAKCIRFELNTCLGPCAGACSSHTYANAVQHAIEFLLGRDSSILERLESDMAKAVEQLSFERAGVILEQIRSLTWLARRLAIRQRLAGELTGEFPISSFSARPCRLLFDRGYLAGFADRNDCGDAVPASMPSGTEKDALAVEWMLIIAGWFQKNKEQKQLIQRTNSGVRRRRVSA